MKENKKEEHTIKRGSGKEELQILYFMEGMDDQVLRVDRWIGIIIMSKRLLNFGWSTILEIRLVCI